MKTVLAADDQKINRELICESLGEEFDVVCVHGGQEALDKVNEIKPDLILLDKNMPDLSGFEVCRKLKHTEETQHIPIIMVTAMCSLEYKLIGCELGADDYITLPYEPVDLLARVKFVLDQYERQTHLSLVLKQTEDTAQEAIIHSGDLGLIVNFLRDSFTIKDETLLALQVLEVTELLGLTCCIHIELEQSVIELNEARNAVVPMISDIFRLLKDKGTIVDFGENRTLFNFPKVSLLVKNMPIDDPDRYGRYKDNLAIMAEGADARIQAIKIEKKLERARTEALAVVDRDLHDAIEEIRHEFGELSKRKGEVFSGLKERFEEAFITMGLNEEQEEYFLSMVDETMQDLESANISGEDIIEYFNRVISQLSELDKTGT